MDFRLLGPLEVWDDGRPLALGGTKQRALLAILLLQANEVVSRDTLIDELWGESAPGSAAHSVEAYISRLRKSLHADGREAVLLTRPPGYVLRVGPDELDVDRFQQLVRTGRGALVGGAPERAAANFNAALSLWRGPPLGDLAFEPFAQAEIRRLDELRLEATEERLEAELATGGRDGLVAELEMLVAAHPMRERLRAQLMVALYRAGRQADALAAYRAGRTHLSEELGLEPGVQLRSIEQAILRQEPALDLPRQDNGSSQPTVATAHARPRLRTPAVAVAVTLAVLALLGAAALVAIRSRHDGRLAGVEANNVGVIDARTNTILSEVPAGIRPGPIAVANDAVWVGDLDERNVVRLDPTTRQRMASISLGATPTGVATSRGGVWVAEALLGRLIRVDPEFDRVTKVMHVAGGSVVPAGGVTGGGGSVWAAFADSTLVRVDPSDGHVVRRGLAGDLPAGIAFYGGDVWVANRHDGTVQRYSRETFDRGPLATITVGRELTGIAAGEGAVWAVASGDNRVSRIDPSTNTPLQVRVGVRPTAVAVGAGAVWVANSGDGTVSRIDPRANRVTETIRVGNAPAGIAVAHGLVWVTVQAR